MRGHVTDLASVTFKTDDALKFAFPTETTAKVLIFAGNGKFYTLEASKLPGGRGHGEPIRMYFDIEQDAEIVGAMAYQGGRKFLVASYGGNGFIVPEEEVLGTTRKGKQVLNLKAPDKAVAIATVDGELVATIGENRKMVIFKLDQVPEMTRGRGVRLQKYREKGLSDVTTFKAEDGLTWLDGAGRTQTMSMKDPQRLARQPRRCRPHRARAAEEQQVPRRAGGGKGEREGIVFPRRPRYVFPPRFRRDGRFEAGLAPLRNSRRTASTRSLLSIAGGSRLTACKQAKRNTLAMLPPVSG